MISSPRNRNRVPGLFPVAWIERMGGQPGLFLGGLSRNTSGLRSVLRISRLAGVCLLRSGEAAMLECRSVLGYHPARSGLNLREIAFREFRWERRKQRRFCGDALLERMDFGADGSAGAGGGCSGSARRVGDRRMGPECMARTGIAASGGVRKGACVHTTNRISMGHGRPNASALPVELGGRNAAIRIHQGPAHPSRSKPCAKGLCVDLGSSPSGTVQRTLCHDLAATDRKADRLEEYSSNPAADRIASCDDLAEVDQPIASSSGDDAGARRSRARVVADPRQMEAWGPSMVDPLGKCEEAPIHLAAPGAGRTGARARIPWRSESRLAVRLAGLGCLYPLQARSAAMLGGEAL